MTGLWSARTDPPHLAHAITLLRLTKRYDLIHVVLLDSPDREWPICYCRQELEEFFSYFPGRFQLHVNSIHFGKITKEQLAGLGIQFDEYISGNLDVCRNMENLGYKTYYCERAYEDNATAIRLGTAVKKLLT